MRQCHSVLLLLFLLASVRAEENGKPAAPSGHIYLEAEEFFSLEPVQSRLEGFFGEGYRTPAEGDAPPVIDKTVFIFGNPKNSEDYTLWVRALAEKGKDRRLSAEWIGQEETVRLDPTHAGGKEGFHWENAGTLKGKKRTFYQLRLHAVGDSRPVIDAVLLTADPDCVPKETVRPPDDKTITLGDGEGSTRIHQESVVAGSDVRLEMVYTVGPSGIAQGGALRFFVPESWTPPQCADANATGHVSASTSRKGVQLSVECHRPGKGAYAYSHELRHAHECFVRLTAGSLREGDTVAVTYAGTVQPFAQSAADFRNEVRAWYSPALPLGISTDANGDGIYWTVPPDRSHRFEVTGGKAADFAVVAPSIVRAGEPIAIKVAALDAHRNPAPSYAGDLTFSLVPLDGGEAEAEPLLTGRIDPGQAGWRRFDKACRIERPGAYAVRVRDEANKLEAVSNPIQCVAGEPEYRIFWGDIHTHHRRCDGLRRFDEAAAHARDVAGSDLVALSPHACYITDGDLADLWRVDERFNRPGEFVTIFAYEWAAGGKGSSHSVIYSERPMPLCFRAWGGGNVVKGRPALWEQLDRHKLDVVEVGHHVNGVMDRNPKYQKAVEIYSQWGCTEGGVALNFNEGLKACLFGTSDNHTGQPALQPVANRWAARHHLGGLTAFLAPRLTRRDLFDAIERRRCYATSACRIIGDFRVEGHRMGEEFRMASPEKPRRIELEAIASSPIAKIDLLRNGKSIHVHSPNACVAHVSYTDQDTFGGPTDWYAARIECDDDHKAWLTPVWVAYDRPVVPPERRLLNVLSKVKNLARRKPVITSFTKATHGEAKLLTDGKLDDHLGHGAEGQVWVQVDLGSVQEVAFVRLWNYFRDGRTFHGNRLALSPTGEFAGEETVVFDSEKDGEYAEKAAGRIFAFKPVRARYIRSWLDGSTSNPGSQWIELEAYAPIPEGAK